MLHFFETCLYFGLNYPEGTVIRVREPRLWDDPCAGTIPIAQQLCEFGRITQFFSTRPSQ